MPKPKNTYLDLLAQRRKKLFVGRNAERDAFERNFRSDQPEYLIFSIHGQAGIGKSFLVDRFRTIAKDNNALTAISNEAEFTAIKEQSIINTMARLEKQLSDVGNPLDSFAKRYKRYRECIQQVESDPNAPDEIFDLLGRTAARLAIGGAKMTPVGQAAGEVLKGFGLESGAFVEQAGAWAGYLAKKFKNNPEDVSLVKEPVKTLTPLFVADLNNLAEDQRVVLCLDTWEQTGTHLDDWLRSLLDREGLSSEVWLVIAGRNPLGDEWEPFHPITAAFELQEFTEEETRDYLKGVGITEEARVSEILAFSGGIPVLVSTLSSAKGGSATEAANDLVDRYLKWVDDKRKRAAALNCAAAREINKDVIATVMGNGDAEELFDWLKEMPFLQIRPGYWEYHPKVRSLMIQFTRNRSLGDFRELHRRLQNFYSDQMKDVYGKNQYHDEMWRHHKIEALYHGLMQQSSEALRDGLEIFLLALRSYYPLAGNVAIAWGQASEELGAANEFTEIGGLLIDTWFAIASGNYVRSLPFCEAMQIREDLSEIARSQIYFMNGLAYTNLEEYEKALENYGRAIELDPEDTVAYINRGVTFAGLKEYERALEDFGRAIELDPKDAGAYNNRGLAYADLKEYERALEDYERAIQLDPEDTVAYNNRGVAYAELKEYQLALEDYRRAIELDPEFAISYTNRGNAHANLQEYGRAVEDYGRAIQLDPGFAMAYFDRGAAYANLQEYARAVEDYGRAIQLDPQFAGAYNDRGIAYANLKEYARAVEDYGHAIQLNPENARAYYNRGNAYVNLQEYAQAVEDYGRAIQLDPENATAYYNRGNAHYVLKEYEWALEDFGRAVELDPQDILAYLKRGLAYADLEQYERAAEDFGRAIQLDPQFAVAYFGRGVVYADLQEYAQAVEDYGRAIQLDPENAEAYYNRGIAYANLQEYERAVEDYGRAIQLDPEYCAPYYDRGNAYFQMKEYERAVEDFGRAIQLDPEDALAYNNRGVVYAKLKQYDRALEDYRRAIQLDPEEASAYYNTACAYAKMLRGAKSCEWLQKAIALDEESRETAKADPDFDGIRDQDCFKHIVDQ
jgi:tetratricopeptide (TPR) repeat protein